MREAIKGYEPIERAARLRCLAALCRCYCPTNPLTQFLRHAEYDDVALDIAMERFERIPSLMRRRIIATFIKLHAPGLTANRNHDA